VKLVPATGVGNVIVLFAPIAGITFTLPPLAKRVNVTLASVNAIGVA
jgi:hypothetical protein